ncbi:hypothetical protein CEB3_c43510 [Peptococcaceae bacterium CEB3]|nr:hypothetical protein CEB3_c43510 [Peptococcaceae bacterium CEB3]
MCPENHVSGIPVPATMSCCRGNHRNDIFRDDEDWKVYLTLARETKEKYPFLLHTYCLMTNHVHLHIETG